MGVRPRDCTKDHAPRPRLHQQGGASVQSRPRGAKIVADHYGAVADNLGGCIGKDIGGGSVDRPLFGGQCLLLGGLAVGEPAEIMYEMIDAVEPHMPVEKPRYLMGVGTPCNILEAVHLGVDFFDCVMPSRNARHGTLFTWEGKMSVLNEKYARDPRPIGVSCDCPTCQNYSRSYIRHLIKAKESLGMRLAVQHNLYFYNQLTRRIREALDEGRFEEFYQRYHIALGERNPD